MTDKTAQELLEVIQSSNLNFLLGAGVSTPYLPLLGNIEKSLKEAACLDDRVKHLKKYLEDVMLPNKNMFNEHFSPTENYNKTKAAYTNFFSSITSLIIKRKSTILSKQVNVFTTNIDVLMETVLEECQIEYNDGFSGKFNPTFSLANFKKSIYQRSLHFEHISEIPVFNIIKIHGSLTWKHDKSGEKIVFSNALEHIENEITQKDGQSFVDEYKKILVVNPEEAKHLESVLNLYYSELLRMYSSELEKENTSLFILGFSMEDSHIREITLRAAKSNPTLRIFICCAKDVEAQMKLKMDCGLHENIQIFTPDSESKFFTLDCFHEIVSDKIGNL